MVAVHVFNNDAIYGSNVAYYYKAVQEVSSIYPVTGLATGATAVSVFGSNFADMVTAYCKFTFSGFTSVVAARYVERPKMRDGVRNGRRVESWARRVRLGVAGKGDVLVFNTG